MPQDGLDLTPEKYDICNSTAAVDGVDTGNAIVHLSVVKNKKET
jgi:hypothetical protein